MMPNFFIVGAPRCGTTSLANYLAQHPDIFIPPIKEPRYFASETICSINDLDPIKPYLLRSSALTMESYREIYEDTGAASMVGDASVHYLYTYKESIPRILRELGRETKIIISLREPAARAYSHYSFNKFGQLMPNETFSASVSAEAHRISQSFDMSWRYVDVGKYSIYVQAYLDNFPNVEIVIFEDLRRNTSRVIASLYRFLGVDDSFVPSVNTPKNPSGDARAEWINKLIFTQHPLKSAIKPILYKLPESLRYRIRQRVLQFNQRPSTSKNEQEVSILISSLREEFKLDVEALREKIHEPERLDCWGYG